MNKAYITLLYTSLITLLTLNVFSENNITSLNNPSKEKNDLLEKPTQDTSYLKEYTDPVPEEMPSITKLSLKMFISLIFVLIILVLVLYIMKKYFPNKITFHDSNLKLIKIIEKIPVTTKQYIYLVWAVDRLLILGISNGNMSVLSEIKDKSTLEEKIPNEFSDVLARANLNFSEIYNG